MTSSTKSLPVRRIAITVPPPNWFHGIARAQMAIYRQTLIDLGCSVVDVPVEVFLPPDLGRINTLLADLREFQPELAIGLHFGAYALICRLPPNRDGRRPNLFTDILAIPTICLWDHAPLDLANQLLAPHPERPANSASGALNAMQQILSNPLLLHWSRDTGQTRIMEEHGFAAAGSITQVRPPTLPGFTATNLLNRDEPSLGFVGHFYQDLPEFPDRKIRILERDCLECWIENEQVPLWDVVTHKIADLSAKSCRRFHLARDETFFWHFAHQLIVHRAQTVARLRTLGATGLAVTCYGNLKPGKPNVPANLRAADRVEFGSHLATALARHAIIIDVLNPGFVDGYSPKPVLGFAAGGFVLVNRKQDFINDFGELGEAVSYTDCNDLRAKIDRYLTRPRLRQEIGDAIRETIQSNHTLDFVLSSGIRSSWEKHLCSVGRNRGGVPRSITRHEAIVADLLPAFRTFKCWSGAALSFCPGGVRIKTPPECWAYAAQIEPPPLQRTYEPYVRLSLIVENGRIGICTLRLATGELISEQAVSATACPISAVVELPNEEGVAIVIRNAATKASSQVFIDQATLCDRTASRISQPKALAYPSSTGYRGHGHL
jgi:hypothetical protein